MIDLFDRNNNVRNTNTKQTKTSEGIKSKPRRSYNGVPKSEFREKLVKSNQQQQKQYETKMCYN